MSASPRSDRAAKRLRIIALIEAGEMNGNEIAKAVGVSPSHVSTIRSANFRDEAKLPADERAKAIALDAPPEPEDAPTRRERKMLGGRVVPDGPVRGARVRLDGGEIEIEPATAGRALLSTHEHGHGRAVVRVDRSQLTAVIEMYTAARDALPEGGP